MSKSVNNRKALEEGFKKFKSFKKKMLLIGGRAIGDKILEHIKLNGEYYNVTGNTRGSIAWGIYYDGRLQEINTPYKRIFVKRKTLVKGEKEKETGFVAPTGEVHYYGYELSEEFLIDYKPKTKSLAVVFVVGTAYAEYIESTRGLNVMTDSVSFVKAAGESLIKDKLDIGNSKTLPFQMPESITLPF